MISLIYGIKNQHKREMSYQKIKQLMEFDLIKDVKNVIAEYVFQLGRDIYYNTYHDIVNNKYYGLDYCTIDTNKITESYSQIQLYDNQFLPVDLQRYYNIRMYNPENYVVNNSIYESYSVYYGCHVYLSQGIFDMEKINNILKEVNMVMIEHDPLFIGEKMDTIQIKDILKRGRKKYINSTITIKGIDFNTFVDSVFHEHKFTILSFPKFLLKFN